jgi:pimeloyl-ACP methyl ester carboxylesterase
MKKTLAILFSLFIGSAYADLKEMYYQHHLAHQSLLTTLASIKTDIYEQFIDNRNPALGTFNQRFYIDESYSDNENSPVFFYICGEASCTERALNGAIRTYAKKFHAKLVALEHRYYGKSLPRPTLSTEDLQYLSTEQALLDLARFQRHMQNDRMWNGKWVAFGGSYPGSLSAFYRLKFPELVVGALASSAPVKAKSNFEQYDAHVTEVAGPICANNMRKSVAEVESSLSDTKRLEQIKRLFEANMIEDKTDFLYLIADIGATAVQYGMKDEFCQMLASNAQPLLGYAQFAQKLYDSWGITPLSFTAQGAMSTNPNDYPEGIGMRQWFYQSCTEYGYWQNANSNSNKSTRSSLINPDYHKKLCKRLFGITQDVDADKTNSTYYMPLFSPSVSNIFFTNGATDPWSTLSMTEKNGNSSNPNLAYFLIDNAAHCDDLRSPLSSDSKAITKARHLTEKLLNQWLL